MRLAVRALLPFLLAAGAAANRPRSQADRGSLGGPAGGSDRPRSRGRTGAHRRAVQRDGQTAGPAKRRQARLLHACPVLVARPREAGWAALHPPRRRGEPESRRGTDDVPFGQMTETVKTLAAAFRETRDERFAARQHCSCGLVPRSLHAHEPPLDFGQGVPGLNAGREPASSPRAGSWTLSTPPGSGRIAFLDRARSAGLQAWCSAYATWLQTSRNGREEAAALNNHGTWYEAQLTALLLYTGRREEAKARCERATLRLASQIEPTAGNRGIGAHAVLELQRHEPRRWFTWRAWQRSREWMSGTSVPPTAVHCGPLWITWCRSPEAPRSGRTRRSRQSSGLGWSRSWTSRVGVERRLLQNAC